MALMRTEQIQEITVQTRPNVPTWDAWQTYFDPTAALKAVIDMVEAKPSSRPGRERHTMLAYLSSLANFANFLGADVTHHGGEDYTWDFTNMTMPTLARLQQYLSHCTKRGLTASTIQRYMASVRHFIKALEHQMPIPQSGNDYMFIMQAMSQLRIARDIKNPEPDETTSRPAMETSGSRLELEELDLLFSSFRVGLNSQDISTLMGKRDIALIYLGMTSGLRASEIARLRLANIQKIDDENYSVTVRGKRGKYDPVGIDIECHALITQYIDAWNDQLPEDDSRRIDQDTPIFQTMTRHGTIPPLHSNIGGYPYKPNAELSSRTITRLVARRVAAAIPKYSKKDFTAHDMRRTCAYIMRELGYEWDHIRDKLRHNSIATTEKYVGKKQDFSKSNWTKRRKFNIPTAPQQMKLRKEGMSDEHLQALAESI